jgi:hypothetical protein
MAIQTSNVIVWNEDTIVVWVRILIGLSFLGLFPVSN